jgi:colicin import membrane protein
MAEENDGVDEAVNGVLRVGLTAAGRMAEVIARAREQAAREAQAASEHQARELGARLTAERSAARAQLAPVHRADWWDQAQPAAIATAWETARAWQQIDPDAGRAADRIRDEVRTRYGIDVDAPGGDPAQVRQALERRGLAQEDITDQRSKATFEQLEAGTLLAGADRADRAQAAATEPARTASRATAPDRYDTVERRQELAESLEGVASSEAITARVLADASQGRPAHEAVARAPGKTPTARPAPKASARVRQRGELGR